MQRDNKHARAAYSIINRVHFNLQLEPTYIYIYLIYITLNHPVDLKIINGIIMPRKTRNLFTHT